MRFADYQAQAYGTAIYTNQLYPVMGLSEEAGEVTGLFAKAVRDKTPIDRDKLVKELGDVMWMVAAVATDNSIQLDEIAQANLTKLASRKARGVLSGSGDDR